MRWGRWARWPIHWGGGETEAQRIYRALLLGRGQGVYSVDDDSAVANRELRCVARALARAKRDQARGAISFFPHLATDMLPEWERRLGRVPDPRESTWERQAFLLALTSASANPDVLSLQDALSVALGEEVLVIPARPTSKVFGAPVALASLPTLTSLYGGSGTFWVGLAGETADGTIYWASNTGKGSALSVVGLGVRVGPVPLSLWPAGVEKVHYYLSVSVDRDDVAYVATGDGSTIDLTAAPETPNASVLHHLGILVSKASFDDTVKRQKIDAILGPMLTSWVTWDVIASTPFYLSGAAAPLSELGYGGF